VQSMVKMKLAGFLRAATRHAAEARCRVEAHRVQSMVKMKPAGSPRAATRHPAEVRCRAEARRVQSMVKMKQASSPRASRRASGTWTCSARCDRDAPGSGPHLGRPAQTRHPTWRAGTAARTSGTWRCLARYDNLPHRTSPCRRALAHRTSVQTRSPSAASRPPLQGSWPIARDPSVSLLCLVGPADPARSAEHLQRT
jgi:hypothetical protein